MTHVSAKVKLSINQSSHSGPRLAIVFEGGMKAAVDHFDYIRVGGRYKHLGYGLVLDLAMKNPSQKVGRNEGWYKIDKGANSSAIRLPHKYWWDKKDKPPTSSTDQILVETKMDGATITLKGVLISDLPKRETNNIGRGSGLKRKAKNSNNPAYSDGVNKLTDLVTQINREARRQKATLHIARTTGNLYATLEVLQSIKVG